MIITCRNCKTKRNIPDNKIPKDKGLAFKCSECGEKIKIPSAKQQNSIVEDTRQSTLHNSSGEQQNALICIDENDLKKKAYSIVKQMGLNAETTANAKAALKKMDYRIYHLVIIDESFEHNNGASGIIERMNTIDMSLRRRICLVLISDKFNTNDNMASLHSSVNSIIHHNDIINLKTFLDRALMEHKNFYTVYNESLKLAGKM